MRVAVYTGFYVHITSNTPAEKSILSSQSNFGMYCTVEPRHEISNNVVCATSKTIDQPAHMRSLIKAFASRLNIL